MDESADPGTNDGPFVQLFESSGRIRIVEAFLGKRGTELMAAEIAKLAGVDRSTVSRNVDALVDVGLVERRETSTGVLYRVDEDDPAIKTLLEVRRALFGVLTENPELVEREADDDPASEAYVDRAGLVRLFGTPGRVKMIEAFLEAEDEEVTGAAAADLAGIDRSTVSRNVDEFLAVGMIEQTREVGNAKLYRLVADHPVVESLLSARRELLGRNESAIGDSTHEASDESSTADSPEFGNI